MDDSPAQPANLRLSRFNHANSFDTQHVHSSLYHREHLRLREQSHEGTLTQSRCDQVDPEKINDFTTHVLQFLSSFPSEPYSTTIQQLKQIQPYLRGLKRITHSPHSLFSFSCSIDPTNYRFFCEKLLTFDILKPLCHLLSIGNHELTV